jgi:hypothetical protein
MAAVLGDAVIAARTLDRNNVGRPSTPIREAPDISLT